MLVLRKDKKIDELSEIESVIRRSEVCRLAMCDEGFPYLVPLCFGYKDRTLWLHSAKHGRKIDILRKNNRVCVEFDTDYEVRSGEIACKYSMKYRSAIAFGKASFIDDPEEKRKALDIIMAHYSSEDAFEYSEKILEKTLIIRVDIEEISGKQSL